MEKDTPILHNQHTIGLKELISQIKREILDHDTPELFYVGHVDIEISFTIELDAHGRIQFAFIDAGGKGKKTKIHTVKLALEPLMTLEEVREKLENEAMTGFLEEPTHPSPLRIPVTATGMQGRLSLNRHDKRIDAGIERQSK